VTGGAGFIGSHLVDALVAHGARVSVIDDLSNGSLENLRTSQDRVSIVLGSIVDVGALDSAMNIEGAPAEVVFHQAAIASVPRSVEEPDRYVQVNAMGTLAVLEAARRAGAASGRVPRVIYAASSSVYGDAPALPKVETMAPQPLSPYAASKFAGECLLQSHCHCLGVSGVSLRYFNVFGPRQRHDSPYAAVIPRFIEALRRGARPVIYGDGKQSRDFTFIDNVVQANLLAGSCPQSLCGASLNIASGRRLTLLEVLAALRTIMGVNSVEPDFQAPRAGDVRDSLADITAARDLFGYQPSVSFESGLQRMVFDSRMQ
jgi:UDP-glucose 4-epimerase